MGEHNKILDVTYGNFSCRLEGFDDSVETLKAVVSYFQDISNDDTFTLDAPKTPDIETLTKLAEDHTDGTVEVESDGENLSLRVQTTDESAVDDVAAFEDDIEDENLFAELADNDGVQDAAEETDTPQAEPEDAYDAPFAAQAPTPAEHAEQQASVADKLQRIRAVVGRGRAPESDDTFAEDLSDAAPVAAAAASPLAQRLADLAKRNADLMDEDAQAEIADAPTSAPLQLGETSRVLDIAEDTTEDVELAENDDPSEDIAVEDIAEAVSAFSGDDVEAEAAETAVETVEPMVLAQEDAAEDAEDVVVDADATTEIEEDAIEAISDEAPLEAENVAEPEEAAAEVPAEDALVAEAEAEEHVAEDEADDVVADATPEAETAVEEIVDTAPEADDVPDAAEVEAADVAEDAHADPEDDLAAGAASEETVAEEMHEDVVVEEETPEVTEVEAADETSEDNNTAATYEEPATQTDVGTESRPLLLTPQGASISEDDADDEEDFNLQEEVAELARELAERPGNELARHGLPRSVEDAMSRILMETNQHLDEPESKRHRDAFAQLKAAVAATEAARQLGDAAKSRDIGAMFKDDFGALEAEETAKDAGGPSLKLVTDDGGADAPSSRPLDAASARLRQIAAAKGNDGSQEPENFASFAKAQGATELADLLEAAAAYISFVDGDNDFSRPQVMKVAQTAAEGEITREDGLRSFGRLLRQSRIIKLNNGRFQVSDNTRFRPTTNRAARG